MRLFKPEPPEPTAPRKIDIDAGSPHPLKQLIARVIEANPEARSDRLWLMLRKDAAKEPGQREFDIDTIICEINQDEISWFGRSMEGVNCTGYRRFKNLVSEVKKALRN